VETYGNIDIVVGDSVQGDIHGALGEGAKGNQGLKEVTNSSGVSTVMVHLASNNYTRLVHNRSTYSKLVSLSVFDLTDKKNPLHCIRFLFLWCREIESVDMAVAFGRVVSKKNAIVDGYIPGSCFSNPLNVGPVFSFARWDCNSLFLTTQCLAPQFSLKSKKEIVDVPV
jgi:hypothetical protein